MREEIPETPQPQRSKEGGQHFRLFVLAEQEGDQEPGGDVPRRAEVDQMIFRGSPALAPGVLGRAYPSINRLADSKLGKKRLGTAPLFGMSGKREEGQDWVMDEERAALTWHDDEITGHDPTDPDDDGEGINGIGFKPTAAEAYARTQKRKKQMLAYKTREDQEARRSRIDKRRGSERMKAAKDEQETNRKVRFGGAEAKTIVWT